MTSSTDLAQRNLEEIRPIDRRQTAVTMNCILLRMIDSLNYFANRAEDVILKAEKNLKDADIKLKILEQKLSSVVIDDVEPQSPQQTQLEESASKTDMEVPISVSQKEVEVPDSGLLEIENPPQDDSTLLIKDDPVYSKYFKMLKMGVVEAAVRQKMQAEGVDPSIISRGNERSTNVINSKDDDSDSESISSFSDSD